jgi:hypothetical protein
MLTKLAIALVTVLVVGSASAAMAEPKVHSILKPSPCLTDEGNGRYGTCHGGT